MFLKEKMTLELAPCNCSIIILLLLSTSLSHTTLAFTFIKLPPKSPTVGIQSALRSNQNFEVGNSNVSLLRSSLDFSKLVTSLSAQPRIFGTIEWSDVLYDDTSTAHGAWEWINGLSAPAALIAAAVVVSLRETRFEMAPQREDKPWIRFTKQLSRFLLMSSFGLEIASIFAGNMTGSMLLGHGYQTSAKNIVGYSAPLQLLYHHHE